MACQAVAVNTARRKAAERAQGHVNARVQGPGNGQKAHRFAPIQFPPNATVLYIQKPSRRTTRPRFGYGQPASLQIPEDEWGAFSVEMEAITASMFNHRLPSYFLVPAFVTSFGIHLAIVGFSAHIVFIAIGHLAANLALVYAAMAFLHWKNQAGDARIRKACTSLRHRLIGQYEVNYECQWTGLTKPKDARTLRAVVLQEIIDLDVPNITGAMTGVNQKASAVDQLKEKVALKVQAFDCHSSHQSSTGAKADTQANGFVHVSMPVPGQAKLLKQEDAQDAAAGHPQQTALGANPSQDEDSDSVMSPRLKQPLLEAGEAPEAEAEAEATDWADDERSPMPSNRVTGAGEREESYEKMEEVDERAEMEKMEEVGVLVELESPQQRGVEVVKALVPALSPKERSPKEKAPRLESPRAMDLAVEGEGRQSDSKIGWNEC